MTQSGNSIADDLFKDIMEMIRLFQEGGGGRQHAEQHQLLDRGLWEAAAPCAALALGRGGWRALFSQVGCLELEEGRLVVSQPFKWSLRKLGCVFWGPQSNDF